MSSNFRDHLRPSNDPRIANLAELDAYSHAEKVLKHPVAHKLFDSWRELYEHTEFKGITTQGECLPGLFMLQDEQAPVQESMKAVEQLLKGLTQAQIAKVPARTRGKLTRATRKVRAGHAEAAPTIISTSSRLGPPSRTSWRT